MKRISPHIQTAGLVNLTLTLTVQMFYLVTALVDSLGFVNIKGLGAIGKDAVLLLTFSLSEDFFLFVGISSIIHENILIGILRLGIFHRLIKHFWLYLTH